MDVTERVLVTAAEHMDERTFRRHFNLRHRESLGYLGALHPGMAPFLVTIWRTYHRKLHELRVDLTHEHGDV